MYLALFTLVFLLALLRSLLFWVSYIQRKQYRLDRLWHAFNETAFWKQYWSTYRLAVFVLFAAWQILVRYATSAQAFDILFIASGILFAVQAALGTRHALRGSLEKPVFTAKALALVAAILLTDLFLLRLPWLGTTTFWRVDIVVPEHALLLELIQPFLAIAVFAILFLPNLLLQKRLIAAATAKRATLPDLTVIGITGSVGKTSLKEFLAHILASQYRVLKTKNHINVDTGVAKQVLEELDGSYRYYVVEMGAYRPGEIASICRIVRPAFGVITALGNQHLELFGSFAALRKAKFELVDAVRDPKHLFFNTDSPRLKEAAQTSELQPVWFGLSTDSSDQKVTDITFTEGRITFQQDGQTYEIPGFGTARLTNALGAIAVAKALGMTKADIALAVKTLPAIAHTMESKTGKRGSFIIDATYNASLESVLQAIKDLSFVKRPNRIILFKDIIELGAEDESSQKQCAEALAASKATILLLPSPWHDGIRQYLLSAGVPESRVLTLQEADKLAATVDENTVVLGLGRDAQPLVKAWSSL